MNQASAQTLGDSTSRDLFKEFFFLHLAQSGELPSANSYTATLCWAFADTRDSVLCLEGMALEHRDVLREESAVSKLLRDHQRQ